MTWCLVGILSINIVIKPQVCSLNNSLKKMYRKEIGVMRKERQLFFTSTFIYNNSDA